MRRLRRCRRSRSKPDRQDRCAAACADWQARPAAASLRCWQGATVEYRSATRSAAAHGAQTSAACWPVPLPTSSTSPRAPARNSRDCRPRWLRDCDERPGHRAGLRPAALPSLPKSTTNWDMVAGAFMAACMAESMAPSHAMRAWVKGEFAAVRRTSPAPSLFLQSGWGKIPSKAGEQAKTKDSGRISRCANSPPYWRRSPPRRWRCRVRPTRKPTSSSSACRPRRRTSCTCR